MMESNVFERTNNGEQEISSRLYNFTIGAVLCWGFWINWLMVGNIPVESIAAINPWVFSSAILRAASLEFTCSVNLRIHWLALLATTL